MTQNAMQAKNSRSFAEQSVFVSSIPSSIVIFYPLLYDLKSSNSRVDRTKQLEQLLVVGISGFVELAFTFSFNKQRPSYTEKR